MAALLIGYARCSTDQQDLTAQRDGLTALGVSSACPDAPGPQMCRVDRAGTGNRRWGRASRVVEPSGSASLARPRRGVQHLRREERPTRREGERGTHR